MDRYKIVEQRWSRNILIVLAVSAFGLALVTQWSQVVGWFGPSRPDTTHLPLYPQAQEIHEQQGSTVRVQYVPTPGALVPIREITYQVNDGPELVMQFYHTTFARSSWHYIVPTPDELIRHINFSVPCDTWTWPDAIPSQVLLQV